MKEKVCKENIYTRLFKLTNKEREQSERKNHNVFVFINCFFCSCSIWHNGNRMVNDEREKWVTNDLVKSRKEMYVNAFVPVTFALALKCGTKQRDRHK